MPGFISPFNSSSPLIMPLFPSRTLLGAQHVIFVQYIENTTINSKTTVISADVGPYGPEVATIVSVTAVTITYEQIIIPSGYWGPYDTDSGAI